LTSAGQGNSVTAVLGKAKIADTFAPAERAVVFSGDCLDLLRGIPDGSIQLIVTSPPYNLGKEYEKRLRLSVYLEQQKKVIHECVRTLAPQGNICWQVGNYVESGSIIPLDTVLYPIFDDFVMKLRNWIIWRFERGLHPAKIYGWS
jgi:DNA modification methylase